MEPAEPEKRWFVSLWSQLVFQSGPFSGSMMLLDVPC